MEGYHRPVLLRQVLDFLEIKDSGGWYIDATLGDGGYCVEILARGGKVLGIDVDPQAIRRARERLIRKEFDEISYKLIQGNFRDLKNLISQQADLADCLFEAILFDLGVSSLQLDSPERGFSFGKEGPLDMRMDPNLSVTAADLVNILTKEELDELFKKFGQDWFSRRFAEAVVRAREQGKKINKTKDLADIIEKAMAGRREKIPFGHWPQGKHPATRVFQALRIAVNDELHALEEALPQALKIIKNDGNILVISFHSLEDRIVKNTFREWKNKNLGSILTKKPITPSQDEVKANPRSRSAKLRVFRKS